MDSTLPAAKSAEHPAPVVAVAAAVLPAVGNASVGSSSPMKRPRPEDGGGEGLAKRPRSEAISVSPLAVGVAAAPSIGHGLGPSAGPSTAPPVSSSAPEPMVVKDDAKDSAKADAKEPSALNAQDGDSRAKKGTQSKPDGAPMADAANGGKDSGSATKDSPASGKGAGETKSSPSKATRSPKATANGNKGRVSPRTSPRAPLEDREDEKPLDLAAIQQFEYDQVATFGPSQQKRYESYRRSDLRKEKVKKVLCALNPSLAKASDQFLIALKGLAKLFVGDIVETALEVKTQLGDTGALQPRHLREAYRRLRRDGAIPSADVRPGALG